MRTWNECVAGMVRKWFGSGAGVVRKWFGSGAGVVRIRRKRGAGGTGGKAHMVEAMVAAVGTAVAAAKAVGIKKEGAS